MLSQTCYTSAKTLTFARFLLKVLYPRLKSKEFIIYLFIKYIVEINFNKMYGEYDKFGYKCEVIPDDNLVKIAGKHIKKNKYYKTCHQIIVPEFLFAKLYSENIFYREENSLWVVAKIHDDNSIVAGVKQLIPTLKAINSSKKKTYTSNDDIYSERIVQIIPNKTKIDNSKVYMTEVELFNTKQNVFSVDLRLKFLSITSEDLAPKIASELVVEMVLSSVNIGLDLTDQMLINYFKTPKFLHQNDYFAIELTEEYTRCLHYKYLNVLKGIEKIFFKCVKIQAKNSTNVMNSSVRVGYFVVTGETDLKQNQNFNSFIPNSRYITFKDNSNEMNDENYVEICPYGLEKCFNDLVNCIQPFLIQKEESLLNTHIKCTLQPVFLFRGEVGSGLNIVAKSLSQYFGLHFISETCRKITCTTAKQTESKIEALLQKAKKAAPVLIHLEHFEIFGLDSDNGEDIRVVEYFITKLNELFLNFTKFPIIFILSCDPNHEFKTNLKRLFLDELQINSPNLEERLNMLVWLCLTKNVTFCDESFKKINISFDSKESNDDPSDIASLSDSPNNITMNIESREDVLMKRFIPEAFLNVLKKVASKTEGFLFGDLDSLINQVLLNGFMAQDTKFPDVEFLCDKEKIGSVREIDFEDSLEIMRKVQSKKFGALKIPKVQWEDIGGLEDLKKEIFRTIELPLKYPHLLANTGLKRSGLLLWGPPGCGKTLVARAIASQLKATFLSVKGPELLDMYVGQSEKNMRDIFSVARTSAPCVIFLDEAEAVAGARGATGDAGGAADRLVSQLLAELDGVASQQKENAPVIVIAATNRPDLVEPALLRPGRLDKLLYVGPYVGTTTKVRVLTAVSRGFNLASDVDLRIIADQLPDKCTGADLASIVNHSRRKALVRTINKVENGKIESSKLCEADVVIENIDFLESIRQFTPSVSVGEMSHLESLKTKLS